jgi:hypothetical protein
MRTQLITCVVAIGVASGVASAQVRARAIYSNVSGSASSDVPGGGTFDPGFSFFTLNTSPSGQYWVIEFQTSTGAEVLIVGTGTSGTTVLREGETLLAGRLLETIDASPRVNDSGAWAVAGDLSGDATTDDVIITSSLVGPIVLAQETGEISSTFSLPAGGAWDTLHSTAIVASSTVYWTAEALDGAPFTATDDEMIATSLGQIVARKGVTIPTNQFNEQTRFIENFDLDDLHVSADGSDLLVRGDLDGATGDDDVLIYNNAVVLQESVTLSNMGIQGAGAFTLPVDNITGGIDHQFLAGNGDWYAWGQLSDSATDWVVRNGVLIAGTGLSIHAGASETWDDPANRIQDFYAVAGNASGQFVIAGRTSAGRDVIVLDNSQVVLATGDEVDLDGNGAGDGYFIVSFEFDGVRIGASDVYALVTIAEAGATTTSSAFIVLPLPAGCDDIDFNGNAVFPEDQDVIDFFDVLAGAACPTGTCNDIDFNNNGVFPEDQDVIDFFNVLAGGEC